MKLFRILRGIINHPLNRTSRGKALVRFFRWQVFSRLVGYPIIWPWVGNSKLVVERGLTGATGNLYNGLHEFPDMGFLLHFVREDDVFVDVGANVGVYTILASVEGKARVIAIEPVSDTFLCLVRNVMVNQVAERVTLIKAAAGSAPGTVWITLSHDAANHVQVKPVSGGAEVNVVRLDDLLIQSPTVLKIDVEGFETEVIGGATKVLSHPSLKAIIIELNGLGKRYGFSDSTIHQTLTDVGFRPYDYNPFTRTLTQLSTWGAHNTLYIREPEFVQSRVATGRVFNINSQLL